MGGPPKIGVILPPKMDGENNGKTLLKWDDLGGKNPYFWNFSSDFCFSPFR